MIESTHPITVTLNKHTANTMILRQHIAEGTTSDDTFSIGYSLSNGDLIFYFSKKARYYSVDLNSVATSVMEFLEKD